MIGPNTGIGEYSQSLSRLLAIGSIACTILGPKSLAGLIA